MIDFYSPTQLIASKQILSALTVLALVLISAASVSAQTTYYSKASTAWNLASTWTTSNTHAGADAGPPVAGDIVFIGNGTLNHAVVIANNTAAAAASITIATGSSLTVGNGTNAGTAATLAVTAAITVNGTGSITVGGTSPTRTATLNGGASLTMNGASTFTVGNTVNNISSVAISTLTMNGTSTVNIGSNTPTTPVHSFTASGAVQISAGCNFLAAGDAGGQTHTVNFQSTLNNAGTIQFDDDDGANDDDAINFTVSGLATNTGTIVFGRDTGVKSFFGGLNNSGTFDATATTTTGNLVFRAGVSSTSGSFTAGGATFNDAASNAQTIGGTAAMSFANAVTLTDANGAPSLTVTNANTNTVTLSSTTAGTLSGTAGVTWVQGAGSTLSYSGSTISNITLDASTNANTVNYAASASQTIQDVNYHNLQTSGNNTKAWTMAGNRTVGGTLQVGNATTLTVAGAFDFTVTGTTTIGSGISGTFNITNGTGLKRFTGLVTVNAGGVWNHSAANPATSFGGGITMTGTTFNNGSGAAAFTASQSLSGSSNMTFGGSVTPAVSTVLTNNNSATAFINNIVLTGGFTQGSNTPTLSLANSAPFSGAGALDASTNTNTVIYTGANPPIRPTNYVNLTVNGSGSATIGGTTSVSGTMTVSSGVTNNSTLTVTTALSGANSLIQGSGSTLNIGGTSGITTLDANSNNNTVNYTGAAQTVKAVTYRTLGLSGSGAKTMTGVTTINGDFSIGGTATATAGSALTITGNVALGTGTSFTAGAFTHNIAGNWINNGATFTNTGSTINFNGTAQNIGGTSSTTFNNLDLAGSGTKTFGIATFAAADLSIASGVIADLGAFTNHSAYTLTLNGSMQVAGIWGGTGSGAQNINTTFFASAAGRLTVAFRPTITYYSRQTGTWDAPTTWSTVTYGNATNAGTYPVAGDVVNIGGGNFTITVSTNASCSSLTFQGNTNFNTFVSIANGITLNVSGATTINNGGYQLLFGPTYTSTLAVGGGTLYASTIHFANAGDIGNAALTISTGAAYVTGDITADQSGLTLPLAYITLSSTGTLDVGADFLDSSNGILNANAGSTVNYSGSAQTIGDFTYGNLTLSGSDTKTAFGPIDVNGSLTIGSSITLDANSSDISVAGNWVNNGTFTHSSMTVTFDGAAQNIGGSSNTTFNNIALQGSGTKTFGRASASAGYFSVSNGVVVNLGGFTTHTANALTLGGIGQIAGVWGGTGSGAANINATFFGSNAGRLTTGVNGSNIYYTRASGDWATNATWSYDGYGGAIATTFPTAGSIVNVGGGDYTVTVAANAACAYLNFQSGAAFTTAVNLNAGISLNASIAVDIAATSSFLDSNTLGVGAGTLTTGNLYFSDGGTLAFHQLTISTGTVNVTGNITGPATARSIPLLTFSGAGTLNLAGGFFDANAGFAVFTAGTGTVNFNGAADQTITNFTYNNVTTSTGGTKTFADNTDLGGNLTIGAGTTLNAGGYDHTVGGNWTNNGTYTGSGSTITLDGAAQSIGGTTSTTFGNLTLAGSNTKTFSTASTTSATISINSGVVANLGTGLTHNAKTLAFSAQGQIPGSWGGTGSGATNINTTFFAPSTGILNVNNRIYYSRTNNGSWNAPGSWSTVTYGNATNNGTFPQAGDIATIGGDMTINVNVNSACAFLTFQGASATTNTLTIIAANQLDVSGSITIPRANNGESNTLAVGAGTVNAGSLRFTSGGGAGTRHRVTISTGTVTVSGDILENGSTGSATIAFTGAGMLNVGGAFLNSGNGTLTQGTGTVRYNGSVAQTIGDFTYYNLTLNNSYGTIPQLTLSDNTTVTNTLNMTSGIVNLNGAALTLGASGAASTLTRTASSTTNWVYNGDFLRYWPASTAITSSSGNYYGLFPVGTSSASSYRPVEINSTSNPTGTGYFSVTHTGLTSVTDLSPTFNDLGTTIMRKHNARFVMTTNATGGLYDIAVTMTGVPPTGVVSDIRLVVSNGSTTVTTVGTHAAATGSVANPTARRTGVALTGLVGDFRIATIDANNTPLPIELLSFKGQIDGNTVNLLWETASERNNDFFSVERRLVGSESFETIGEVRGNGTTYESNKYSFDDENPVGGITYYRLKQTDFDQNFTYSKVIAINYDGVITPALDVFPNPSSGQLFNVQVRGLGKVESVPVVLFDQFGRECMRIVLKVDKNTGKASTSFAPDKILPDGVYLVKAGATTALMKRIIVTSK